MTLCGLQDKIQTHSYIDKDFNLFSKLITQGQEQNNRCCMLPHSQNEVMHFVPKVTERVAKPDLHLSTYYPLPD